MGQRIIFQNGQGGVTVIMPIQEYVDKYGIDAIAVKDVPAGKPYKIVDESDIPADRSARAAWDVDEAVLTDGVGGESSEFEEAE